MGARGGTPGGAIYTGASHGRYHRQAGPIGEGADDVEVDVSPTKVRLKLSFKHITPCLKEAPLVRTQHDHTTGLVPSEYF